MCKLSKKFAHLGGGGLLDIQNSGGGFDKEGRENSGGLRPPVESPVGAMNGGLFHYSKDEVHNFKVRFVISHILL